ncbi:HNH endonuclease [Flavobacteriaceae bacterium PRS1]|nr:HNH endonuclease [Flavobacteriaceae bacterium PRS1]
MSKIILQPSGNKDAREHYVDTIKKSVTLEFIKPHISITEYKILQEIYPSGECKVWGVTPGGNNITKWNKIERGDVTLFSRDGAIYSSAVTTFKLHSQSLASNLWDYDLKGQTWEYIYFLDEIKRLNIPYIDFNRSVYKKNGELYDDKFIIQGFSVLDENQCRLFFERFDLESEIFVEEITADSYKQVLNQLEGLKEPNTEIKALGRKEQGYLRKLLFGKKTIDMCACCNRELPVSLLVTAHIKKRALCKTFEKLDKNIVMPMCKLGCDEIFEKGYISVKDGKFIDLKKTPTTHHLNGYIKHVNGNNCNYYNDNTISYFDWHLIHHS